MPTALVKKYAKELNVSIDEVEKVWNESKEIAKKKLNLPDDDSKWKNMHWAYVTGIFKKRIKSLEKSNKKITNESNVCLDWIR